MVSTSYFDAVDALIALLSDPDLGLTIWDGPFVTSDSSDAVYIGYDGDPDGTYEAANIDQEWASVVGAKRRDEFMSIHCAVVLLSGDQDTKAARDRARAVLSVVETALRANVSLGQPSPFVAGVKPLGVFTYPLDVGLQVRIPFDISIRTRV